MRHFFHLAYQGGHYRGWQRQHTAISVQEILEGTLSEIWKQPIHCNGCGRTDAGVHASQYFCYSDLPAELPPKAKFILNRRLPSDIAVFDIWPMPAPAHPQYDAVSRTYDYFIHTQKDAGLAAISSWYDLPKLDIAAIQYVLKALPAYQDFRAYCKVPDRHNTTICNLSSAKIWVNESQTQIRFQFTANRFLRGMIRLLVGNLLEVGQTRQSPTQFLDRLATGNSPPFTNLARPEGLYLSKIEYPYLSLPNLSKIQLSLERLSQ